MFGDLVRIKTATPVLARHKLMFITLVRAGDLLWALDLEEEVDHSIDGWRGFSSGDGGRLIGVSGVKAANLELVE
jgi:hypothetical protein